MSMTGFGTGVISLGDLEITEITKPENLEQAWQSSDGRLFIYKPVKLPPGFHSLGHLATTSPINQQEEAAQGLLVVRDPKHDPAAEEPAEAGKSKALSPPLDYTLVWTGIAADEAETKQVSFWLPDPPPGYKPAGYVVSPEKPSTEEVVCVREDITADSTISDCIWKPPISSPTSSGSFSASLPYWIQAVLKRTESKSPDLFSLWQTRPAKLGKNSNAVRTGTFHCSFTDLRGPIFAVKTLQTSQLGDSMPSLDQVRELVQLYAPIVVLHPAEDYFPSSVQWFFQNGALLYSHQDPSNPVPVAPDGSNLPRGGSNDGAYWLDLPPDPASASLVRKGELESATAYLHVKPMSGGLFTDLQFWFYYPFNGPATLKFGPLDIKLGKIGEHVSDWEHMTVRINNFSGKPSCFYLGHHSGGTWYRPSEMEYDGDTGRPFVYSSKNGHAAYAHPGEHLQGDEGSGIGLQNETRMSHFTWDVSKRYEIISAEYLGVGEPPWLQYMREWGPKFTYNSRTELEKVLKYLPKKIRKAVEDLVTKFPNELSGQEGPTGPKEKNFWDGDER